MSSSVTYKGNTLTTIANSGTKTLKTSGKYMEDDIVITDTTATGIAGTPAATKGTVTNNSVDVTPSVTNTTGYITGGTLTGTAVTVSASELVSGTKSIIENGTDIDVTNYASVDVAVPIGSTINNQNKTVTPTTSQQTVVADSGYTGLGTVTVNAVPTETKSITANGTYTPTTGKYFSSVTVNVPSVNISQDAQGYIVLDDEGNYTPPGEWTLDDYFSKNITKSDLIWTGTALNRFSLYGQQISGAISFPNLTNIANSPFGLSTLLGITSFDAPNLTTIASSQNFLSNNTSLVSVNMPKVGALGGSDGFFSGCSSLVSIILPNVADCGGITFDNCTSLEVVVLPKSTTLYTACLRNCTSLQKADILANNYIGASCFQNDGNFTTLILRKQTVTTLSNISAFTGTPFASGGAGGTIYIPETLYNHLGDGTSLDYKAANNWSTIDGYGTITWAKIEDSYYETHYANNTLIATS